MPIIERLISSCEISPSIFCVYAGKAKLGEATLNVPGEHNVRNALGVIALATELGIPFEKDC